MSAIEEKDDGDDRRDRFGRDRRRRERSRSRSRSPRSRSPSPGRRRKSTDTRDRDRDNRRSLPSSRRRTLEELMRESTLLSLGQFMEALGLGRDDADAQKKYDEYKLEFSKKAAKPFFDEHKNDAWFREKYHPTMLEQRRNEKIARVEQATKDFIKEAQTGTAAPVLTEEVHANDAQVADKPAGSDSTCVYVKNIPPSMPRADLKKTLSSVEGATLLRLRVSEPMPNKAWIRLAWAFYETEAAADKVLAALATQKVNGVELSAEKTKDADSGRRPRITPYVAGDEDRIAADLDLAKQISQKLLNDLVPANPLATDLLAAVESAPAATPVLKLDLLCTYLRTAHHFCLYCAEQYEDDEELRRRCGPLHVRGRKKDTGVLPDPTAQQWAQMHDAKLKAFIVAPDTASASLGKDLFNKLWDGFVARLDEKKWQCTICGKMFMGPEFVRKHLTLKHQDKQAETQTKAADEQFFTNYVADPQRLGHTPLAPPPAPLAAAPPPAFGDRRRDFRERDNRRGHRGRDFRDRERDMRDDPGVSAINSARGPLRSYVDLDAPADDSFGDFHSAL